MNLPHPVAGSPQYLEEQQLTDNWLESLVDNADLPYYVDIDRPESVPGLASDRQVDLAERILSAAGTRTGFGHHEELRRSMVDWAPDRDESHDDDPGYWREIALTLTPDERHFGRIEAEDVSEQRKKAATVIAWAEDCIDGEVLAAIEREQIADWKDAWRTAIDQAVREHRIRQFRNAPPAERNGWERVDPAHDVVEVAYRGLVHGTETIVAVFDDGDDQLECLEFTTDAWNAADGDPREARPNRHPVATDVDNAYGRLHNHLGTFDATCVDGDRSSAAQP